MNNDNMFFFSQSLKRRDITFLINLFFLTKAWTLTIIFVVHHSNTEQYLHFACVFLSNINAEETFGISVFISIDALTPFDVMNRDNC